MKRKTAIVSVAAFLALVGLFLFTQRAARFDLQSTEEPIFSLVKPFRSVDAAELMDGGSVVLGVEDATGKITWLFAKYDYSTNRHLEVFRGGLDCRCDPADQMLDSEIALSDMRKIMEESYPMLDEGTRDALKTLKSGSNWRVSRIERFGDSVRSFF